MRNLLIVTLHQVAAASLDSTQGTAQTEDELFRARARALRKQRKLGLAGWFKSLIPAPVMARIAAHRSARALQAEIARLEQLSFHLLGDIGVEKEDVADYVLRTDDLDAVRAWRLANSPFLPARQPNPLRPTSALLAG